MTLTNAYATLAELKDRLDIRVDDYNDDATLERNLNAASRQIDRFCDRRFWADGTVVVREYTPDNGGCLEIDDLSTVTGLIVKIDNDGNGTFETTLTINTDFRVEPINAPDQTPVVPYTQLRIIGSSSYAWPQPYYDRPTVQVTGTFGWSAVPDEIAEACLLQAAQLYKARQNVFGFVPVGDFGAVSKIRGALNPIAQGLVAPYAKPSVA